METADETTGGPDDDVAARATLEELVAEPERVAGEATARPVRIERGADAASLMLLSRAEFDRLAAGERERVELARVLDGMRRLLARAGPARHGTYDRPVALRASELTDEDVERLRAQPVPPELEAFDDEIPEGWLDEHERLLEGRP